MMALLSSPCVQSPDRVVLFWGGVVKSTEAPYSTKAHAAEMNSSHQGHTGKHVRDFEDNDESVKKLPHAQEMRL